MKAPRSRNLAVLGALTTCSVLLLAGPASAHHAEVLAVANCSGQVNWTVQAWPGVVATKADPRANELSRTNLAVTVEWSGDGTHWTRVDTADLRRQNGYTDSGSFRLPSGDHPARFQVRATAGLWANNALGGDRRVTPAQDLSGCAAAAAGPNAASQGATLPITLGGGLVGSAGAWLLTRRRGDAS